MANRWLAFLDPSRRTAAASPREPVAYELDIDGRAVPVVIRRHASARRFTLRLTARGDGATVTMPKRGSLAEARAFVERHRGWIAERLAPHAPAVLDEGATVPVRGVPHRIQASGGTRGAVRVARDAEGPVLVVPGEAAHRARRVSDHLKAIARADLSAAVARHAAALGVKPKAVRIKDTTSRWGSASSAGTLSFSWRLAMAPPFVLDYLAAHEVAHLKEMNHSDRFWAICVRLAPRTEEARAWLKAHGRDLHRMPTPAAGPERGGRG